MRLSAVHLSANHHLLDHIAPLCFFLKMPLFVSDDFSIATHFYPQIEINHLPDFEMQWHEFIQQFDVVFRCGYWNLPLKQMLKDLYQKKIHFVFCPHGQSDKGFASPHLAAYKEQEIILLYGSLMQEMLKKLNFWPENQKRIVIGNHRLSFYERHKKFYDELIEKEIFSHLSNKKKTILYAPTWQDAEESSTFFSFTKRLIETASGDWNWIIKPHPLLEDRHPGEYFRIVRSIEKHPNIFLLTQFPLIYPLLNRIDVYLGDASSIGYDFLYFEKPMFFVKTAKTTRLMRGGKILDEKNPIQCIESNLPKMKRLISAQRALYNHAFANKNFPDLRKKILDQLSAI